MRTDARLYPGTRDSRSKRGRVKIREFPTPSPGHHGQQKLITYKFVARFLSVKSNGGSQFFLYSTSKKSTHYTIVRNNHLLLTHIK